MFHSLLREIEKENGLFDEEVTSLYLRSKLKSHYFLIKNLLGGWGGDGSLHLFLLNVSRLSSDLILCSLIGVEMTSASVESALGGQISPMALSRGRLGRLVSKEGTAGVGSPARSHDMTNTIFDLKTFRKLKWGVLILK